MIPLYLRISGFLSYRDPVDLDFSTFSLASITGANGAGKSSLLDAITWALFGQARRRDDSLINHASSAAEIRLDFKYEGNIYRIQRTKPKEKAALLEFFICQDPGQYRADEGAPWKPLTERSIRETEACIVDTLRMDYDTFTNASFFLQGKADQFAQQRPSERKRILSSILGLEIWETYREEVNERRKALETECQKIDGRLHEIQVELGEETGRRARLQELESDLERLAQARESQENALESLRRLAASLAQQRELVEAQSRQLATDRQNLDILQRRLEDRQQERSAYASRLERAAEIEAAYQAWVKARQDLERWDEVAARFREQEKRRLKPLQEIENARTRLQVEAQSLENQRAVIEAERAQAISLGEQAEAFEREIARLQAIAGRRGELDGALRDLHQQQADSRAENPRLKADMDELKERIGQLEQIEGANCPVCGQPLSADEKAALIESLRQQGKTMGDRYRKNQDLLKDFENRLRTKEVELAELAGAEDELRRQSRLLDGIQARRLQIAEKEAEWVANGGPRLSAVERCLAENDYAREAQVELETIDLELKAMGYDAASHDEVRRAEIDGRTSEADLRSLENARAALGPLEREIGGLAEQVKGLTADLDRQQQVYFQAASAYAAAAAQVPDVDQAEVGLMNVRAKENQLRMEVGAARQKVLVLDDLRARQAELNHKRDGLNRQIARHKTLERAFSKDGVPALLIEQALPEIEGQANEFLDRLSSGMMSVSFATQREYRDKKRDDLRETLDILISDGAGTRDYELFSGGEAFRVNFAIRLALSKVLAQRAGARLQTLVIDEGFGSQDALGRQRLIEAINLVRDDFAKILVITHLEEMKDAFPNRIEVEKGLRGSTVRVG
ncbi:MAG TPA: SMC family ATPase [Anaerolineaceae bacterium]|nr:SMC family ATPase [Anaerolineaceae bacterium]